MLLLFTILDILHALEKKETKQDGNWTVTLESQIIEGVGIIRVLDIVIIINNREGWNNRGQGGQVGGRLDEVEKVV